MSIPRDLLEQFDSIVREKGFSSRYEAIEQMLWLNGVQYVKLTTMPESMPQGTNVLNCNSPAI